jgi:aminoglycoside 3-N-acetyltransferase
MEVHNMSEEDLIKATDFPLTIKSLAEKLREAGMAEGQNVVVHMAMSKLGWLPGGAQTVIQAFLDVLGEEGTLMMPAHTNENTDPAEWQHPPVPESWWQTIRDEIPAFDPAKTPTRHMGAVAELFRRWPNTLRSNHPVLSFAAHGKNAEFITHDHDLVQEVGERSPLGRLYELDGYVMLLGVEHWNNSSLHLAEFRSNYQGKRNVKSGTAMFVDGKREWVWYEAMEFHSDDFGEIGKAFDAAHAQPIGKIAQAEVRFFKQRALVDFAKDWMEKNRKLDIARS